MHRLVNVRRHSADRIARSVLTTVTVMVHARRTVASASTDGKDHSAIVAKIAIRRIVVDHRTVLASPMRTDCQYVNVSSRGPTLTAYNVHSLVTSTVNVMSKVNVPAIRVGRAKIASATVIVPTTAPARVHVLPMISAIRSVSVSQVMLVVIAATSYVTRSVRRTHAASMTSAYVRKDGLATSVTSATTVRIIVAVSVLAWLIYKVNHFVNVKSVAVDRHANSNPVARPARIMVRASLRRANRNVSVSLASVAPSVKSKIVALGRAAVDQSMALAARMIAACRNACAYIHILVPTVRTFFAHLTHVSMVHV